MATTNRPVSSICPQPKPFFLNAGLTSRLAEKCYSSESVPIIHSNGTSYGEVGMENLLLNQDIKAIL